ncbi:NAD(P)/FAD-dependent oxidoreductase [Microbacterium sp. 179-B 1A2 NHS]|uniref:NAD(P)/FAD-dependent oxidoreductase n=1 Tax=Microbacterium sp. 179-B 1A2 NHS TaxID=3142383 RepID=UPI00399EEC8A
MTPETWDAIIIGGGTAGLSAAQMLGRARRRTLVIDAGDPRNRFAEHMHGVLGHDGKTPAELLEIGRREARAYGVTVEPGRVVGVADLGERLEVEFDTGRRDTARALLLATGVSDDLPDIPGMREQWGTGVLHCPYCHGFEVAGRRLGVLATSPAGIHQIELVRQWTDDLTAFTAAAEPLDAAVRERLDARGIRIVDSPATALTTAAGVLSGLTTADGAHHPLDALFTAPVPRLRVDHVAALDLARSDQPGSPLAADALGATSHPRVWAAGNLVAPYGNVPLSMGQGSFAGAAINAALVMEDAARAAAARRSAAG